ncbi:VCBS repeat-containing protein [bacterium]|nr:VCBS repeat-containing protein [bacterium]
MQTRPWNRVFVGIVAILASLAASVPADSPSSEGVFYDVNLHVLDGGIGGGSQTGVVGDFNEDGHLDMANSIKGTGKTLLSLGRGDGTFLTPGILHQGGVTYDLIAADLDGDRHLDIAVSEYETSGVLVLAGNGDGTFAKAKAFPCTASNRLAVGDLNSDGLPEIVAPNLILWNGGGLDFSRMSPISLAPSGFWNLEIVDMNRDGRADIVGLDTQQNSIHILLNLGDEQFAPVSDFPTDIRPYRFDLADMNEDGYLDAVVSDVGTPQIGLMFGDGTGALEDPLFVPISMPSPYAYTNDINNDGHPDMILSGINNLTMMIGTGGGNFEPESTYLGPDMIRGLLIGDFDGDSNADLALWRYGSSDIYIIRGSSDGTLQIPYMIPACREQIEESTIHRSGPAQVILEDVNGDGREDAITLSSGGIALMFLLRDSSGAFEEPILTNAIDGNWQGRCALAAANLNGDAFPDAMLWGDAEQSVAVAIGAGDGTFMVGQRIPVLANSANCSILSLDAADFDRNGTDDLVVGCGDGLEIYLSNGDGTLATTPTLKLEDADEFVAGELNGDHIFDLVASSSTTCTLTLHFGVGQGGFQDPRSLPMPFWGRDFVITDLNADQAPDLLLTNSTSDEFCVLLGQENGDFSAAVTYSFAGSGYPIWASFAPPVCADFNGDGFVDVAAISGGTNRLAVLPGRGDGIFGDAVHYFVGNTPTSLATGDLDNDGVADILATNSDSLGISILLSQRTAQLPIDGWMAK